MTLTRSGTATFQRAIVADFATRSYIGDMLTRRVRRKTHFLDRYSLDERFLQRPDLKIGRGRIIGGTDLETGQRVVIKEWWRDPNLTDEDLREIWRQEIHRTILTLRSLGSLIPGNLTRIRNQFVESVPLFIGKRFAVEELVDRDFHVVRYPARVQMLLNHFLCDASALYCAEGCRQVR